MLIEEEKIKDILVLSFDLNKDNLVVKKIKDTTNSVVYEADYTLQKSTLGINCNVNVAYFEIVIDRNGFSIKKC